MKPIVICSSKLARKVIKENDKRYLEGEETFHLKDIKPHRENKERSVYVFEYSKILESFIEGYKANN